MCIAPRILIWMILMLSVVSVSAEALTAHLPSDTDFALRVQCTELRQSTLYHETVKRFPEAMSLIRGFEYHFQIHLSDCHEIVLFSTRTKNDGMLLRLPALPPNVLESRLNGKVQMRKSTVGQYPVYFLRSPDAPRKSAPYAIAYLKNNIVLAGEQKDVLALLQSPRLNASSQTLFNAALPEDAVASFFYQPSAGDQRAGGNDSATNAIRSLSEFRAVARLTGANGSGLNAVAQARCANAASAQSLQGTANMFLLLGQSFLFADNPVLGQELLRSLEMQSSGNTLNAKLELPPAQVLRLLDHANATAQKVLIPPDDDYPTPIPLSQ